MGIASRIFASFLIIITSFFLLVMPITTATYEFRTNERSDSFLAVTTGVGVTSANVTLLKAIYDNDTGTIVYTSSIAEAPAVSTYNTTSRQLLTTGLTANTSRTLTVQYDITSLSGLTSFDTILNYMPFLWYILIVAFTIAALAAVFTVWKR